MDKKVKNVLTAVGAVAVVKASPVLALGAAIGAYAANPQKANKAVMDSLNKTMNFAEDILVKAGVPEEELERVKNKVFEKEPKSVGDLMSDEELASAFDEKPEQDFSDLKEVTEEPKATVHYEEPHCGELW